jgi:hypothetical protein
MPSERRGAALRNCHYHHDDQKVIGEIYCVNRGRYLMLRRAKKGRTRVSRGPKAAEESFHGVFGLTSEKRREKKRSLAANLMSQICRCCVVA